MMFSLWRMAMAYKISSFNDGVAKIRFKKEKVDTTPNKKPILSARTETNKFSLNA